MKKMSSPDGERTFELFDGRQTHRFKLPAHTILPYQTGGQPDPITDLETFLTKKLRSPIGTLPLADQVKKDMNLLLICDDYTRPTPGHLILPPLLNELNQMGIPDHRIKILIAAGHHREMSAEEKEAKFGSGVVRRIKIIHHDSQDQAALVYRGKSTTGIDIWLNKLAVDADFRIGLGVVEIHPWAGFAGGSKIVNPGIAGKATIDQTHSLPILPQVRIGKTHGNPFWETSLESARMLPLNLVINCLLDLQGRLIDLAVGDPHDAQAHLIKQFLTINGLIFQEPADIVITTAYPKFQHWGQAAISLYNAAGIIKPGGIRITLADCPEGMGDCPFEKDFYLRSLTTPHKTPLEYWENWLGKNHCSSRNTCAVHRHLVDTQSSEGIMVSGNLPRGMINQPVFDTLDKALHYALTRQNNPKIAVYDKGGMVLVTCNPI